jgi:hypothetical protein
MINSAVTLKAFPDTLYIGFNATVGFTKSTLVHECAFDVPLSRVVLETDAPHSTPAAAVAALGRSSFCHSGLIPFVAAAVAECKGNPGQMGSVSAVQVARIASENTARLYGGGIAVRAREAAAEAVAAAEAAAEAVAAAAAATQAAKLVAEEEAAAVVAARLKGDEEAQESGVGKKKKKKKGKGGQGGGTQIIPEDAGEGAGARFDTDFFTAMGGDGDEALADGDEYGVAL